MAMHLTHFERYEFFRAIMERDARPLGFDYDDAASSVHQYIFSKQITENWKLCLTVEQTRQFFLARTEGNIELELQMRNNSLSGSTERSKYGESITIQYQKVVPGFLRGYWEFILWMSLKRL